MKLPRAMVFDFDGVIVKTEQGKFKWLKRELRTHGITIHNDDFSLMAGKKTAAFLAERFGLVLSPREIANIRDAWRAERLRNWRKYSKPIIGAVPFIKWLKERRVRLCLATGTERLIVRKALGALGVNGAFSAAITGDECEYSKPNPAVYLLAAKALKVPKKEILVVEDSAAGVLAAKQAGLRCVAITTTQKKKELQQADSVVRSFGELRKKLEKAP